MVSVVRCWKAEYQKCKHSILLYIQHRTLKIERPSAWDTRR